MASLGDQLNWILRSNPWLSFVLCLFLSPVFDLVSLTSTLARKISRALNPKTHDEKVKDVQEQVRKWNTTDQSVPMCTSRPAWMSFSLQKQSYKSKFFNVHVDMDEILELDTKNQTVTVEPSVEMGQINDYLQRRGWSLPVVPEINCLTIGGLVMGGGMETTSKKYGFFQYICLGYELVLADASVIWCDKDNHDELFKNIPFSYGTFGFLTSIKLQIIPIKKYLKLQYEPTKDMAKAVDLMYSASIDPLIDVVEVFVYSKDEAVVMTGTFVDNYTPIIGKVNCISRWYKPWFYTYVQTFFKRIPSTEHFIEYIPTMDYYQRHVKAMFWMFEEYIKCWNHPLIRYPLGWMLPVNFHAGKMIASKILGLDLAFKDMVVQDLNFEVEDVVEIINMLDKDCHVYPIWLCPFVIKENVSYNGKKRKEGDIMVDVGVYGFSHIKGFDTAKFQLKWEKLCLERHGALGVWTKTFLTKEQFEGLVFHDPVAYKKLRQEYQCEKAFPHVYYKISNAARD